MKVAHSEIISVQCMTLPHPNDTARINTGDVIPFHKIDLKL